MYFVTLLCVFFICRLVQNNEYLSHKALHLFLQSKLSSDEIDSFLEANQDEDATETILAEAEVQARLHGYITRDRVGSKHDSGISGDYDDPDFLLDQKHLMNGDHFVDESTEGVTLDNNNVFKQNKTIEEDAFLSDGHNADIESEDDERNGSESTGEKSLEDTDENELDKELIRLRLSSLPAPLPEPESGDDQFESSVEISLHYDSSDNISDDDDDDDDEISEKRSISGNSLKGETTSGFNSRISSQENVRQTPSKRTRRRFSRNSSFRKMFCSNASLPECGARSNEQTSRDHDDTKLRRSKSFYEYRTKRRHSTRRPSDILNKAASFSDCKSPVRQSSFNSHTSYTPRKLRRTPSFMSSTERSPVKRKISLNEYIIVGRNSFDFGGDPKEEFNKSSL